MPLALAATPRKMLPPPMTMPTSTPSCVISLMSDAIAEVTAGSIPKFCSPINASPDSFSRTRLYMGDGGAGMTKDDYSRWGLLRMLADLEAGEPGHRDVFAHLGGRFGDHLRHRQVGIADELLIEQHDLLIK